MQYKERGRRSEHRLLKCLEVLAGTSMRKSHLSGKRDIDMRPESAASVWFAVDLIKIPLCALRTFERQCQVLIRRLAPNPTREAR
jgi:hypothetical protein